MVASRLFYTVQIIMVVPGVPYSSGITIDQNSFFYDLTLTTPLANLADDKLSIFSYFSQKTGFEMSGKLSPTCMKCKNLFSWKNKKNILKSRLLEIISRVLSVNPIKPSVP